MDPHSFMRACREGGAAMETALIALDRSLFAMLYRDCVRMVRSPDVARDLVQETFIKVWQRCATFRGESELLPWIRTILRHRVLDFLRRQSRESSVQTDDETHGDAEHVLGKIADEKRLSPEDTAQRRQLAECFERCWDRFERASPVHAAVLVWVVEDGLGTEDIARLLGRTPGATREFISQCRKRARVHLEEWYGLLAATHGEP